MSEEQLKAFLEKVKADTSLQEKLKAEGADVVAIAKAAGFSITTEDLNSHRQGVSDDELEGAAGGSRGFNCTFCHCRACTTNSLVA
jgi:predicted ribosomally synthesized peptide with nif11-like leader